MVRAVALKTPACRGCPTAGRAEHIFVTLESIKLRPAPADENSVAVWLEIAPQLASEPHQIDLLDGRGPELLVENAAAPAGSYREVRLQFLPDTMASAERIRAENRCGGTRWNCIVMASGQVAPFRFPGGVPELFLPIQQAAGNSFLVLPDSKTELRLSFEPRLMPYLSETEGWKWQLLLSGSATMEPQGPVEPAISSGH